MWSCAYSRVLLPVLCTQYGLACGPVYTARSCLWSCAYSTVLLPVLCTWHGLASGPVYPARSCFWSCAHGTVLLSVLCTQHGLACGPVHLLLMLFIFIYTASFFTEVKSSLQKHHLRAVFPGQPLSTSLALQAISFTSQYHLTTNISILIYCLPKYNLRTRSEKYSLFCSLLCPLFLKHLFEKGLNENLSQE